MPRFDYPEPYAVRTARRAVLDSLRSHGEMSVLFRAYHPSTDVGADRCSCYDDVYKGKTGDRECTLCYGTSYASFKDVTRVWCLFTDTNTSEDQKKFGVWTPDNRKVQLEGGLLVQRGDFLARVSYWDGEVPLTVEGVYVLGGVVQESLRTGAQYGQSRVDVVGQSTSVSRLADSHPIYKYPFDQEIGRPSEW